MRQLATIRTIDNLQPIEGADFIETAVIGGWNVVVKKGEHYVGQLVVYLEIDSWVPEHLAPFLGNGGSPARDYEGVVGFRLKSKKLRGVVSQGLILPLSVIDTAIGDAYRDGNFCPYDLTEGGDVTEILNIKKYEKPVSAQLAGMARGNFPIFIPKTDQERCVSGDTIVSTDIGNLTIRDIVRNNIPCKALSLNITNSSLEYKEIIGVSEMRPSTKWLKITTANGNVIKCTPEHRIWCPDIQAFRQAIDIKVGQILLTNTDQA